MYKVTHGLVVREAPYRDSDKILTVLTESDGKLTVSARGAKSRRSKIAAASQLLAFSEMTLYSRNGRWMLTDASTRELFGGLRTDVERLALGMYFAELLEIVSDEDSPGTGILSLGLNSLYALSREMRPEKLIKAAFELRLMCLAGYEPNLDACGICGKEVPLEPVLYTQGGTLLCMEHRTEEGIAMPLCAESLKAMRYIVSASPHKIFSFSLEGDALKRLSDVCELYVGVQLDRGFKTLDFYKSLEIKDGII